MVARATCQISMANNLCSIANSSPVTDDESSCNDEITVIMSSSDLIPATTAQNGSEIFVTNSDIDLNLPEIDKVVSRSNKKQIDQPITDDCKIQDSNDSLVSLSTTPVTITSEVHPILSSSNTDHNEKIESPPASNWCQNETDEANGDSLCSLPLDTPSTSGQRPSKPSSKINSVNTLEDNIQDLSLSSIHSESLPAFPANFLSSDSEMSVVNECASQASAAPIASPNSKSNFSDDNDDSTDSLDQLNLTASLNFSKLLIKRKQLDNKTNISKKQCTDKQVRQQEIALQHTETPLSSGASSTISVRKRIPSKENPPPKLDTWLNTFQNWSNAERLMALDQLIEYCEPTQVRHMMSVIEPQFQRDFISLLPKELALYVLSFLEPRDLLRAAQTCRYWRILAEDNLLWREKCREAYIDEVREVLGKRRAKSLNVVPSPWKSAYMRQQDIEMNWRCRQIRVPKALKGHDDHVITCLQFSASRIVSGSDDNTLKVWSAITGKCLRTLMGHTGGVWSSQMAGNIIVSGSTDRTLKVWNSDTGQCIHTLYGHTSTVRCMDLYENKVVSGSRDATLRVWNVDSGECLHVLIGHVAAVRCVQYDGRLVVSGAYDYMVKVWNPETEECLHTLQGHTNRVYSLQFDGVHVVSGSLDTSIRVWDVETGSCKHTLMGHQSLTSGMELKNNILVSGNADSTVKVWDITTGQCLQTLSGPNKHHSAVTCLQFNSTFVITSSDDGTVKLWDLKTGEFIRNLVALESGGSGGVVWRIRASHTKLVCAVGSRNGTEETKLLVLDFDVESK